MQAIYNIGCCHNTPVNESIEAPEAMQKEAERIAKGLYNGTIQAGTMDARLTRLVALELRKAVIEGFGKDLNQLDYGTPHYNKLAQLEKNVYHFSGAKNYQELKSMSLALKDEHGLQREYKDFKLEALKIDNAYNGRYLKTEYDTATGSAQSAAQWVDIKEHEDLYPLLEFDAVMDSKTSSVCRMLNGIIAPVNSPFVKKYYPPNHFNERLTVKQRSAGTPTQNLPDVEIPAMFAGNIAEDGYAFPARHPYYLDCPPSVLRKAELLRDNVYSPLPKTPLMKKDVFVSSLAHEADLQQNLAFSRRLSEHGVEVHIQPHSTQDHVKNAELKIGASSADFKTDSKRTSVEKFVRNAIDSANTQKANIPIIVLEADRYSKQVIWQALRGELLETKRKKNITDVWLLLDDNLVKVPRENIFKNINQLP